MTQPEIEFPKFYIVGGVYAKELQLRLRGDKVVSHSHNFDHLSLLAKGRVAVTVNGISTVYNAPTAVNVRAFMEHEIEALVDDCLWYCIHAVPDDLRGEAQLDSYVTSCK